MQLVELCWHLQLLLLSWLLLSHLLSENFNPEKVIGIDNHESSLFFLEQKYLDDQRASFFIADIRDRDKLCRKMKGIDIVFEHPGQATMGLSVQMAKWGGIVVTSGATSGYEGQIDLRHIFFREVELVGSTLGTVFHLLESLDAVQAGYIKPVIHSVLPMKDGGEGQRIVEDDEAVGKVVLVP